MGLASYFRGNFDTAFFILVIDIHFFFGRLDQIHTRELYQPKTEQEFVKAHESEKQCNHETRWTEFERHYKDKLY